MENLNAEQIKKAVKDWQYNLCVSCEEDADCKKCVAHLLKQALALITSQEQRIVELTEENERLSAEKEELKDVAYRRECEVFTAKADAVKQNA